MIIAIDGPAAAGKGTLARAIARHLDYAYLDTGSLYRAVGHAVMKAGFPPENEAEALKVAQNLDVAAIDKEAIRTAEAGHAASVVAAMPAVRAAILDFQRHFARQKPGAVLDGRDIGTVVCPDADVKFFVTARPEIRAHRRWLELKASGSDVSEAQVLDDVRLRDQRDSERATSPLKPANDAHLLDTSDLSIEASFGEAVRIIDKSMR